MPLTTCAAVITLPLLEIRTPEPVSLKRVTPPALTSRPLLRTTITDGLTLRKMSSRFWAWAAGAKAGNMAAASIAGRTFFMGTWYDVTSERRPQASWQFPSSERGGYD